MGHPYSHPGVMFQLFFGEEFYEGVDDGGPAFVGYAVAGLLHLLHLALQIIAGGGDSRHSQRGLLPGYDFIHFSHRDIKTAAQCVAQAAHALATIL